MHPKQSSLLQRAQTVVASISREAAVVLWKYVDPDNAKEFYLKTRRKTVKSPWSAKSFQATAERFSIGDVGKELKADNAKVKNALWKYTDDAGNEFYLPTRLTTTLKSPFTGKAFTPKPEKDALTDVSSEIRDEQKDKAKPKSKTKKASDDPSWRA
jgi:hypothetical protein